MAFVLPPLPYPDTALEPHVSARTLQFHHGKHHKKYVDTLNKLIAGTDFDRQPLEDIILGTANEQTHQKIFNNASQAWNHNFFWQCMMPQGGGQPDGELLASIQNDFGSLEKFRKEFIAAAEGQFGSGWVWLIKHDGKLKLMTTGNADLPLPHGITALLACDVWEHAYYLDYQNDRAKFVEVFLSKLVNWKFAQQQLSAAEQAIVSSSKNDKHMPAKNALNSKEVGDSTPAQTTGSNDGGIEGEGSYSAARAYREGVEKSIKSGEIEEKAQDAKRALESAEGAELREAERRGKRVAKMEDPALHKKNTIQLV